MVNRKDRPSACRARPKEQTLQTLELILAALTLKKRTHSKDNFFYCGVFFHGGAAAVNGPRLPRELPQLHYKTPLLRTHFSKPPLKTPAKLRNVACITAYKFS
jgi:hypothetical protein